MSQPYGPERPDLVARDVDADHRLASGIGRISRCLKKAHLKIAGGDFPTLVRRASGRTLNHQVSICIASSLLVLGSMFLPATGAMPGFARDLVSDATVDQSMSGNAQGSTVPESAAVSNLAVKPAVQPSDPTPTPAAPQPARLDPLPGWVQPKLQITLWSRSDAQGDKLASLQAGSYLKVLGQPENGRLPVYLDEAAQKLGGWVDLSSVQASGAPPRIVASSRGGARPNPDISTNDKFIAAVAEAAQESQRDSKVPAAVTIAQAILESDWGRSLLSKNANNYFGIKATSGPGPAGVVNMNTLEVFSGQTVMIKDGFKAYNNLYESIMDHGRFLADNARYAAAFQVTNDAQEFARRIHAAGYATDPGYSTKLINLMNRLNLYQYSLTQP